MSIEKTTTDIVLEARNVSKVYEEGPHRVQVLKGVSLSVGRGEIVCLEGPSGSGKTTLLSIMGCILTPTSGQVVVAGIPAAPAPNGRLRNIRRRHIGFIFQQFNLFPSLTALENVEYALNVRGLKGDAARTEAERALQAVGLSDRLDFLPSDLSGGQKQRVAIARAVAGSPSVLLADEPTANLDTAIGGQILDVLRDLARRQSKGVLIVTHDPKVRLIADRVESIRDGRLDVKAQAA